MENASCHFCQFKTQSGWFFCPNCGKELKEKVLVVSVSKQILIYSVSFFLAPLGLGWGIKYVRSKDKKIRNIGIISIALTILAIILMIGVTMNFINQYSNLINGVGNYNDPGFFPPSFGNY